MPSPQRRPLKRPLRRAPTALLPLRSKLTRLQLPRSKLTKLPPPRRRSRRRPQLRRSRTIRNLDVGATLDYYESASGGGIETRIEDVNLGVVFENNASVSFNVVQTFDRLAADTRILSATIPAGDYK